MKADHTGCPHTDPFSFVATLHIATAGYGAVPPGPAPPVCPSPPHPRITVSPYHRGPMGRRAGSEGAGDMADPAEGRGPATPTTPATRDASPHARGPNGPGLGASGVVSQMSNGHIYSTPSLYPQAEEIF